MKRRRTSFSRNPVAFVCAIITISCLFVVIVSVLRLPDASVISVTPSQIKNVLDDNKIGKFGEMIVDMLPDDLAFTIFMPSEGAFERDLRLKLSESLVFGEKLSDTYALLTRVLGFSVVPRMIVSGSVPYGKEISYDSLSGMNLFVSKDLDGTLIVNRVRSVKVDVMKGKIVIHIMDGAIMEAEFEQSVRPDYGEED